MTAPATPPLTNYAMRSLNEIVGFDATIRYSSGAGSNLVVVSTSGLSEFEHPSSEHHSAECHWRHTKHVHQRVFVVADDIVVVEVGSSQLADEESEGDTNVQPVI